MRSKVTVVLLFLNVVLFAYIYFYDKPRIEEMKTQGALRRVLGPEAATIESLTRTNRAGETVRLEKRTDAWWLTAPYEWPADRNAIAGLISSLELLEHETSFSVAELAQSSRSLADYGLAEPALTLKFVSSGRDYTLLIGDTTEVGNRLYVLSPDGSRIHVVNRSLAEAIGLPLETLRSSSLFTVPVFEVRSLNVQIANLKVRVRRDAAARWDFEAPINARASKAIVEVTINQVNALTARTFLEPRDTDLERTGLNSPALRVTLEGNARRETLLLGNPTGATVPLREGVTTPDTEYFAKIDDKSVVFTTVVPKPLEDVLRAAQEELRDPRVLDFDPATVTALTITAPGQPELSLQRLESIAPASAGAAPAAPSAPGPAAPEGVAKDGWQVIVRTPGAAPLAMAADPDVVAGKGGLLEKISLLVAREARTGAPKFLSDAPSDADIENWGFKRPAREITLNLSTGGGPLGKDPSTLTLQVGISPDKPGEAFARVTNAPFVYQILPDILDDVPAVARHYRLRVLRKLPGDARITELKLTTIPAGALMFGLANEGALTAETIATLKTTERARAELTKLLGLLRTLSAKSFAVGAFNPDHAETPAGPQPWKYKLEITLILPGGNGTAQPPVISTLYFTDRLGGTTMLVGTPDFEGVVFEATQEMLDTIFVLTYTEKHDPGPAAPAAEEKPKAETPPKDEPAPAATGPTPPKPQL